jgi:bacterioferritin-associated ferredoxin
MAKQSVMTQKQLVCHCNHVSTKEINNVLKAGAFSIAEIQQFTSAGTGCGRCVGEIREMIEKYRLTAVTDPQLKLTFK